MKDIILLHIYISNGMKFNPLKHSNGYVSSQVLKLGVLSQADFFLSHGNEHFSQKIFQIWRTQYSNIKSMLVLYLYPRIRHKNWGKLRFFPKKSFSKHVYWINISIYAQVCIYLSKLICLHQLNNIFRFWSFNVIIVPETFESFSELGNSKLFSLDYCKTCRIPKNNQKSAS